MALPTISQSSPFRRTGTQILPKTNLDLVFTNWNVDAAGNATFVSVSGDGSGLTNTLSVGDSISGAADQLVLFTNGTTLAQDSLFRYDDSINVLEVGINVTNTNANAVYSGKYYARETSTTASLGTASLEYSQGADTGIFRVTKETGPSGTYDNMEIRLTDASNSSHQLPFRVDQASTGIYLNFDQRDYDTIIRGDTDANLLHVDAGTDRVGIGIAAPATKLEVGGDIRAVNEGRDSKVVVRQLSDFPAAVGGVITLLDNTIYEVNGSINLGTDRIEMGDESVLTGENQAVDTLIYTDTGNMITSTDSTVFIEKLTLAAPGGTVFGGTNVARDEFFIVRNCTIGGSAQVANTTGFNTILVEETLQQTNTQGWQINNTQHVAFQSNLFFNWNQAVGCNFIQISGGTPEIMSIENNVLHPETNETAIDIDTGAGASVNNFTLVGNNFVGEATGGTYLSSNIDVNNSAYTFSANRGLADATDNVAGGSMLMEGNATVTTIGASATWTKVAGTTVDVGNLLRFSMNTDNELTYDGDQTVNKTVFVSLDASRSGGSGNEDFLFTVFQNGSKVANVQAFLETNLQQKGVAFQAPVVAANGDTFEVYVQNPINTTNCLIQNMQVSIS